MFYLSDGRVFVDKNSDCKYFNACVTIENSLFPNQVELDVIDFVTYLNTVDCVSVILDTGESVLLDKNNVFEYIGNGSPKFRLLCLLANDLRTKGWYIRRGINYGADFLLYDSDPNNVHSKFAVYMVDTDAKNPWSFILGMNRVCVNAKKVMLLATSDPKCPHEFKYVQLKRWIAESNRE